MPPQGFGPEAETRGGILIVSAYRYKVCKYRYFLGVYRKNLDLIEVGTLRVSGVGAQGVLGGVIKFLPYDWLIMT